jgi:hypothetical protein
VGRQAKLEGSRFVVWQLYRMAAGGSRELPSVFDGPMDVRTLGGRGGT